MSPHFTTLVRVLRSLLLALLPILAMGGRPASAETIRLLDDNDRALEARYRLIDGARRTIDCSCFELRNDDVSYAVLARLGQAARRGVRVRLIVDAYGNRIPGLVLAELIDEGVEIRRYHPLDVADAPRYAERMHDKLLVADGRVMILGGRNLGKVYFGRAAGRNFVDGDFEVTGTTVDHAAAYFEALWTSRHVIPFCCHGSHGDCHCATAHSGVPTGDAPLGVGWISPAELLQHGLAYSDMQDMQTGSDHRGGLLRPPLHIPAEHVYFVHSSRAFDGRSPDINDQLLALIESARREIVVETPYLVLSPRFAAALQAAVCRGVSVRLLSNSLASTDKPIAHAGYVNQKRTMLRMGIDLWEYQGPDMLHAKTLLIDETAVVGSYDLHPRSEYYDSEIAIVVTDARFTAALRPIVERHFAGAIRAGRSPGFQETRRRSGLPPHRRIVWMHILRLPAVFAEKHL